MLGKDGKSWTWWKAAAGGGASAGQVVAGECCMRSGGERRVRPGDATGGEQCLGHPTTWVGCSGGDGTHWWRGGITPQHEGQTAYALLPVNVP